MEYVQNVIWEAPIGEDANGVVKTKTIYEGNVFISYEISDYPIALVIHDHLSQKEGKRILTHFRSGRYILDFYSPFYDQSAQAWNPTSSNTAVPEEIEFAIKLYKEKIQGYKLSHLMDKFEKTPVMNNPQRIYSELGLQYSPECSMSSQYANLKLSEVKF